MYGSDAAHSMEPDQFKLFCSSLKEAALMRHSKVDKNDISKFKGMKKIFEKKYCYFKLLEKVKFYAKIISHTRSQEMVFLLLSIRR